MTFMTDDGHAHLSKQRPRPSRIGLLLSSAEQSTSQDISCSALGKLNKRQPLCVIIHYKEIITFITTAAQSLGSDEGRNKRLKDVCEFDCRPATGEKLPSPTIPNTLWTTAPSCFAIPPFVFFSRTFVGLNG